MMRIFITRFLIPAAITFLGLLVVLAFFLLKPRADRKPPAPRIASVTVLEVVPRTERAMVPVQGLVEPSREVVVMPQVSGKIVSQSDRLIPGGTFARGEPLASIDPRDYRLAIQQEQSRMRAAELELQLEQQRQGLAEREWELLGDGRAAAPLALRRPHLVNAEEGLTAASAGLQRAELNLERTVLRAPFNAMVIDEHIDVGQVVGPNTSAITLVGTDRFWVRAAVPVDRLAVLEVPGVNAEQGSPARIVGQIGVGDIGEHAGEVVQLAGQLDASTRTGQLLIAFDDPLEPVEGGLPLLPGAFVEVAIEGRPIDSAVRLPRTAVVDGDRVWLADAGDLLAERTVEIGWRTEDEVIVTGGLRAGDRVVTSPLHQAIAGMPVKVVGNDAQANTE
jgi:RND family efflux transporter MFP subunit